MTNNGYICITTPPKPQCFFKNHGAIASFLKLNRVGQQSPVEPLFGVKVEHLVESLFESFIGLIIVILDDFLRVFEKVTDGDKRLFDKDCLTLGDELAGYILGGEKAKTWYLPKILVFIWRHLYYERSVMGHYRHYTFSSTSQQPNTKTYANCPVMPERERTVGKSCKRWSLSLALSTSLFAAFFGGNIPP